MPFLGFKERVRVSIRMATTRSWAGSVSWEVLSPHPDMSEADLYIALACYFYVRAMNLPERERAEAVHAVAMRLVKRLDRDEAANAMAAVLPDPLKNTAPLVAADALPESDALTIQATLGIANNGMSPGTVHLKKSSWRKRFEPAAVLLMIRDLAARLGPADRARLAIALRQIAAEYERRGDIHVGTSEASVSDPALTAAGVWKRG